MSVRLQLDNGKEKKYCTWRVHVEGEYVPPTYRTECGMIWDTELPFDAGCKHIDCAIFIAKYDMRESMQNALIIPLYIMFLTILFLKPTSDNFKDKLLIPGIICLLLFVVFAWSACTSYRQACELKEFGDHGTVNGIQAQQL